MQTRTRLAWYRGRLEIVYNLLIQERLLAARATLPAETLREADTVKMFDDAVGATDTSEL